MIELGLPLSLFSHFGIFLDSINYPINFSEHFPVKGDGLEIKIRSAYMRNLHDSDDWEGVVIKGTKKDDLNRVESQNEPWELWLSEYSFYNIIPET